MLRSLLLTGLSWSALGMLVGCGSVVIIEESAQDPEIVMDDGESDAGTEPVESDGCACSPAEICFEGACLADERVFASLLQTGTTGVAAISAVRWGGPDAGPPPTEQGDCMVYTTLGAAYDGPSLNLGSASLQIDGGPPLSFPPLTDGSAMLDLGAGPVLSPNGGQTITVAWSGGADVPASSIAFTTALPVSAPEVPPMFPGEPWTLDWTDPSPEATIDFDTLDGNHVTCFSKGSTITMPGAITAVIDDSGFPYSQTDMLLALRPPITEDVIGDGVVVSGIALRFIAIDIPPP